MADSARWTVRLVVERFAEVEKEIASFLASHHVGRRAAYVSQLVIEEIVRNLIEHTPPYAQHEEATVDILLGLTSVTIVIEDSRPPFSPEQAPALDTSASLDERRAGGMGVHLVRSLTDSLVYSRSGERNRLTATVART